ncbi:MAG: Uma2 family endonuclease [Okeania sp. SIO2G4]|uniref:Uma2 family endonuclease n=1 Tax=unclassified Okeania TaxID=2634635 RepID=UPI0013B81D7F|nr:MULTISPECIES: Uma2 family endonuclease [unclassified Okeania]NEP07408.1 Uma2 family endonuclease [Okeania sp. SIO4D6]NEP70642.1 Uma2 family endonuclease [Okeania sp. SIO2G5]NEP91886.1 Uma2 family endonuclease [Okeania sp. SIO2F5]NEQ89310.1 Uma2 family endonuclease [Okeania sp. SIO2G4]
MNIATENKILTDQEFQALSEDGSHYELINGEVVDMGNSGMEHGNITAYLCGVIELYARPKKLGVTCDSSTAFTFKSGNKRSPDIYFVSKDRLLGLKRLPKGYFQGAPDLAVEVISPNNTFEELHQKIVEYFENNCRLVWVINPDEKSILIYHKPQPDKLLQVADNLDGEDILPGFTLPVTDLFMEWDF